MKSGKEKPITKQGDNNVGNAITRNLRDKAKTILPNAKQIEQDKSKKGWVWLKLGKTSKQVHPSKVNALKAQGWK